MRSALIGESVAFVAQAESIRVLGLETLLGPAAHPAQGTELLQWLHPRGRGAVPATS